MWTDGGGRYSLRQEKEEYGPAPLVVIQGSPAPVLTLPHLPDSSLVTNVLAIGTTMCLRVRMSRPGSRLLGPLLPLHHLCSSLVLSLLCLSHSMRPVGCARPSCLFCPPSSFFIFFSLVRCLSRIYSALPFVLVRRGRLSRRLWSNVCFV